MMDNIRMHPIQFIEGHFIDQIVYKLYGLTEEEIKVVEEGIRGR